MFAESTQLICHDQLQVVSVHDHAGLASQVSQQHLTSATNADAGAGPFNRRISAKHASKVGLIHADEDIARHEYAEADQRRFVGWIQTTITHFDDGADVRKSAGSREQGGGGAEETQTCVQSYAERNLICESENASCDSAAGYREAT